MPEFRTPFEIAAGVRTVLDNRDHWVFATDLQSGHMALSALAILVVFDGFTAPPLLYASFHFQNLRTMERTPVSLLAIPKSRLTLANVREFMHGYALDRSPSADRDIFAITNNPDLLMIALDSIRRGKAFPITDPEVN
jgi:hypothetical protein